MSIERKLPAFAPIKDSTSGVSSTIAPEQNGLVHEIESRWYEGVRAKYLLSDAYLIDKNKNPRPENTLSAYRNDTDKFLGFLDSVDVRSLDQIKPSHFLAFINYLQETHGNAPATVERAVAGVRHFISWAEAESLINPGLAYNLVAPDRINERERPLQLPDLDLIQKLAAAAMAKGGREAGIVGGLMSGVRVSAILDTNVGHVELSQTDDEYTVNWTVDMKAERILTFKGQVAYEIFFDLIKGKEKDEPVFTNRRGERLTRQGFWLILKTLGEKNGFDVGSPDNLRMFVLWYLEAPEDIQRVLGVQPSRAKILYDRRENTKKQLGWKVLPQLPAVSFFGEVTTS